MWLFLTEPVERERSNAMAEKYGTIPPKFTLAWFEYVWTYYKWHIIIPIAVILFAGITMYQCTHRPKYDAEIIYAGHVVFTDSQVKEIPVGFAQYVDDVNGDGKQMVFFQQINFSDQAGMEEMDYNMQMKLDLQFQRGETFLFLYDKSETDIMIARESAELIYLPVTEWADKMPAEDMLYSKDGVPYAVSLANNKKIKDIGIKTDDLYLTLRINYSEGDDIARKYENAKKLANALISE